MAELPELDPAATPLTGDEEMYTLVGGTNNRRVKVSDIRSGLATTDGLEASTATGLRLISRQELASPLGDGGIITFGAIPQTYEDLVIVMSTHGGDGGMVRLFFNSDIGETSEAYSTVFRGHQLDGSEYTNTVPRASYIQMGIAYVDGFWGTFEIVGYRRAAQNRAVMGRWTNMLSANPQMLTADVHGVWEDTAPITSLSIQAFFGGGGFAAGSVLSMYGRR